MVEHDVENDFDPRLMKRLNHATNLQYGVATQVILMRSEEAQWVIAPVVGEFLVLQKRFRDKTLYWQQLDAGDTKRLQIADHFLVRHAGKLAAQLGRNGWMADSEALQVRLVQHRSARRNTVLPQCAAMGIRDHDTLGHERLVVAFVELHVLVGMTVVERVVRIGPAEFSAQLSAIGVKQELVGIEAMPEVNLPRAMHPIRINSSRRSLRQIAMPDLVAELRQLQPLQFPPAIGREQAQFDPLGMS